MSNSVNLFEFIDVVLFCKVQHSSA